MQNKSNTDRKPAQRVIKKYPNRRLYDTDTSSYITLAEIKQLVMENEPCVVRDAKTGEDLTRSILLQIILEEEANGTPMFTAAVLANDPFLWPRCRADGRVSGKHAGVDGNAGPFGAGDHGRNLFQQMEQMQKQTEQLLGTFGLKARTTPCFGG
jgi:hypothetical protein